MAPTLVDGGITVAEPTGQLAALYVRHVPAANRLAFLLTGYRGLAEELVHDAFVKCVGRFGHLRAHEAFGAYLRRTIVNLHTSRLRRVRVERAFIATEAARAERGATGTMPDVATREDLWQRLRTLPPRQ